MSAIEHHLRLRGLEVEQRVVDDEKAYHITAVDIENNHCAFPRVSEPISLTALADAGVMAAWANPAGIDILVLDVIVDVTTKSTDAADMNVGVAADAVTSSDTLIDGLDVGTAIIFGSVGANAGTNGRQSRKMTSTQFITFNGSAATTGLVGTARVIWVPLPAAP